MGLIYGNACCNIASTWAKDGADGCFSERDTRIIDPLIESTTEDNRSLYYRVVLHPDHHYQNDITFAPLNRRAWVVQERYLARRQLSFSKRQVYWECLQLNASEQHPDGVSPLDSRAPHRDGPTTAKPSMEVHIKDFAKAWCALVDLYSQCDATRKSDKLIALAGLAGEIWKNKTVADKYLAGLWRSKVDTQLCWRADGRRINRSRISPYVAPTWSWASLDSPVVSDALYFWPQEGYIALGEVLDAVVYSSDNTKLHSFTGSKLVLRGIAFRAHAMPTQQTFFEHLWIPSYLHNLYRITSFDSATKSTRRLLKWRSIGTRIYLMLMHIPTESDGLI
ncbi:hypothetical protein GGR53DRAFT_471197 [Hypoxylon sp. FL1150]|nr:hypothetical protein GGR53DRAFT_471197 [Hypoxylon sp. FL1150]